MTLALVMGSMIGSGVFLLPASLAPYGWNAVPAWFFTIGGVICLALMFARLTRALPMAEGANGLVEHAFGPLAAFLLSWSYWVSIWVGNAAISVAAISYLSSFLPFLAADTGMSAAANILLIWGLTLLNLRGARTAGQIQLATMAIKLIPMVVVLVLAAIAIGRSGGGALLPYPTAGLTFSGVSGAAALTLWALVGFEAASFSHGSIDRPEVNIPRATIMGTLLTGLIYLTVCSAIALMLPQAIAIQSNAPFADFVTRYWGAGPALAIAAFAAVSAIGALNGLILVQGETFAAMARAGQLPPWWGRANRAGAPARATIASSLLTSLLVLSSASKALGSVFTAMALLSTAALLLVYLMIALAALRLKVGGLTGLLAVAFSLWTLWGAGLDASGAGLALMMIAVPVYYFGRWRSRVKPTP